MIRFILFPLMFFIVVLVVGFSFYILYKLTKWLRGGWKNVKKYTGKIYDNMVRARSRRDLPIYLQQGMERLARVKALSENLPERWALLLRPVVERAEAISDIVLEQPKRGEGVRSFFTVTLDALEGFVVSLSNDHGVMGSVEEEKALQSLEVFEGDFIQYEDKLNSKRRFDFQVMTEVIKRRLRK